MAASKLKGKNLNRAKSYIRKDIKETTNCDSSGCDFNFGDIAWVRVGAYTWWPAQVVDDKGINPNIKPRKKSENEVFVRLYGTYTHLYTDPVKNNQEFQNTLKQNGGSIREILEKALEEELSRIRTHRRTKQKLLRSEDAEMQGRNEKNEGTNLMTYGGPSSDKGRVANGTEDTEKARRIVCKIKSPVEHLVRKRQPRQRDRDGTLGDMKPEEDDDSGINCLKDEDKASDIDPKDKNLKKNVKRKQPVRGKSRDRTVKNQKQDSDAKEWKVEEMSGDVRQNKGGKQKSRQQGMKKLEQDDLKKQMAKEKNVSEVNQHQDAKPKSKQHVAKLKQDGVKEQKVKEKTGSEVKRNQDGKRKPKQQDVTELEHEGVKERKAKGKAAYVTSNQPVEKKPKLTEKTGHEVPKDNTQTQGSRRIPKQHDSARNDKADAHRSAKHAKVGETPDASARRMKVMQSLGLIAPSGSPFHKTRPVKQ